MAERTVTHSYQWRVQLNTHVGWRQHLAGWLHRLACAIDGRYLQAWDITTTPPLTAGQRNALMVNSHKAMCDAVRSEVRAEAMELCLRDLHPELFAPHGQDQ